jgi:ribosomal protein L15E
MSAYMVMLFVEFPQHRRVLREFWMARWKKSPREWRARFEAPRLVPRWRSLLTLASAPLVYARVRIQRGTRSHPRI